MAAGLMHTGYYFGFFLAAIANYTMGAHYGWRAMFIVGGVPALLIAFFYNRVEEPARWREKKNQLGSAWTALHAFKAPFSKLYRRRTILNSIYMLASIAGLMGRVVLRSSRDHGACHQSWPYGFRGRAVVLVWHGLTLHRNHSRRDHDAHPGRTLWTQDYAWFLFRDDVHLHRLRLRQSVLLRDECSRVVYGCLFFLGIGGANFAVYSLWIPEQYGTECRVSAFAFTTNIGRFAAAGISFMVGAGVRHYQTLGIPVALTSIAFLIGILLLPLGIETKGKPLPS